MSTSVNIEIAAGNFCNKKASDKAKLFIGKIKSGELKRGTLPDGGAYYTDADGDFRNSDFRYDKVKLFIDNLEGRCTLPDGGADYTGFDSYSCEKKADSFIDRIMDGTLKRCNLINESADYTGIQEFKDYRNYSRFLESRTATVLFKTLNKEYEYK
jgi:hypothetical protein